MQRRVGGGEAAKANPRAIAEKIATRLKASPLFSEVAIAGPGFINLKLKDEALQSRLQKLAAKPDSGLPKPARARTW